MAVKLVPVNERGLRIGEDHQHAKLTNREIDMLLELREQLDAQGKHLWGYKRLAKKFDISPSHARYVCKGHSRCQSAHAFKKITL
jgi:hypothetical protein